MSQHEGLSNERQTMNPQRRRNLKVVVPCIVFIGMMIGLVAYSPTLYRLFCAATGFGGTTQRADSDRATVSQRMITVRFDSNVARDLPWRFEPAQREVRVHLGEQQLVFFTAENLADQAIVGHATFMVTPETTGIYFNKVQCFCFEEERLNAHQKVDMPVVFFVDPALTSHPETRDVGTITPSYTFFRSANPDNATASSAARPAQLLDTTIPLRSVAAASDGLRWLTDPGKFLAGTRMPVRVLDASARRDIIAYLQKEGRHTGDAPEPRSVARHSSDRSRKQ